MKKKVCLVTWHTSLNFGTCIQSYALAEYLRKKDCDVYIPDSFRYYYGIKHPIETLSNMLMKAKRKVRSVEIPQDIKEKYDERFRKNYQFAREMSGVISFCSRDEYDRIINNSDIFISGSDQIWNPEYVTPPLLLSFAGKNKYKIAYGSSIGVSEIPNNKINIYKKYLPDYEKIGVREETAKKVLSSIVNPDKLQVVLDPSFLLDRDDWERIAKKPDGVKKNTEFIFCYFVGENQQWVKNLDEYVKKTSLDVKCMPSESMIIPEQFNCMIDAGVREFIWCLLHAKFVLTDSFHATALSINFGQPFIVYKRFLDDTSVSQNSRITDVLKKFNLESCLKHETDELCVYHYDEDKTSEILRKEREKSFSFLNNILSKDV